MYSCIACLKLHQAELPYCYQLHRKRQLPLLPMFGTNIERYFVSKEPVTLSVGLGLSGHKAVANEQEVGGRWYPNVRNVSRNGRMGEKLTYTTPSNQNTILHLCVKGNPFQFKKYLKYYSRQPKDWTFRYLYQEEYIYMSVFTYTKTWKLQCVFTIVFFLNEFGQPTIFTCLTQTEM